MKRARVNGEEQDAFSCWRRVMAWRPGERKAIKRRSNRRERRKVREVLRTEFDCD